MENYVYLLLIISEQNDIVFGFIWKEKNYFYPTGFYLCYMFIRFTKLLFDIQTLGFKATGAMRVCHTKFFTVCMYYIFSIMKL